MSYDVIQEFIDEPRGNNLFLDLKEPGEYFIRLLPDPDLEYRGKPNRFFACEYAYLIGSGETRRKIQSPKTFGGECPFDEIEKEADADTKKILGNYKLFRKLEQYLFPCLLLKNDPVNNKNKIVGFRILQTNRVLAVELAKWINNPDYTEIGEDGIADLDEGYDLKIVREGKQLLTKWEVKPARKSSKVPAKWLDEMTSIMDMLEKNALSYEEVEEELLDYLEDEGLDLLDEIKTDRKKKTNLSGKKSRVRRKSEPEDDDEDDEEDEDEEDDLPIKKRKTKKVEPEPEDDEEEDEDEEDEEEEEEEPEEAPIKKRGRPAGKKVAEKEPVKKGRGRPKKQPEPEDDEDEEDDTPVIKKGRGRPPKKQQAEPEEPVRRRGRPAAKKAEPEDDDTPVRRRGRPAKSEVKSEAPAKRGRPRRKLL